MQVFTQRVPRESANFFPPFLVYRYLYMHVHVHTEATCYMAKYVCIHIIHNTMRVTSIPASLRRLHCILNSNRE